MAESRNALHTGRLRYTVHCQSARAIGCIGNLPLLSNGCLLRVAALAITLGASVAVAQSPAQPDRMENFRAHDRNGDGRIDRAEFQGWMVDAFFQLD